MRRFSVLLIVALAFTGLVTAAAAQEKPYMVHVGLGYCKVLNDGAPDGSIGLEAGLVYRLQQTPQVGIGAELGYLMLGSVSYTETDYYGNWATVKGSWTSIPFMAQVYYFLEPKMSTPVLTAGLGLYPIKVKVTAENSNDAYLEGTETNTDFGLNFGGGMLFGTQRSQLRFGLDGRFHLIMTEVESTNLITIMGRLYF